MKDYLLRLGELAGAGFLAGSGEYVATHGLELSKASVQGLVTAGLLATYGLLVKRLGDKNRPTAN